jgi:hypothetical protein
MRISSLVVYLVVLSLVSGRASAATQPPLFDWVRTVGGPQSDAASAVALDGQTNVYVTGNFNGTVSFGTNVLSASGSDMFLAKYDRAGNCLWARAGGTSSDAAGRAVAADRNGNILITGSYVGTLFSGTNLLTSTGPSPNNNVFVAKYNPSGTLLWTRQGGGNFDDVGQGLGIDAADNYYVTGFFTDQATFGTNIISRSGAVGMFLARYTSTGTVSWVRQSQPGDGDNSGVAVAVQTNGISYTIGNFTGSNIVFGSINVTNHGTRQDIFIVKHDTNGTPLWAKGAGGSGTNGTYSCCIAGIDSGDAIALDPSNNVFVAGTFTATAEFGTNILVASTTNGNAQNVYLAKYDTNGNVLWVRQSTNALKDTSVGGVGTDSAGEAYLVGFFSDKITFGNSNHVSLGSGDIFLTRWSSGGNFVWSKTFGSTNQDSGYAIAVNGSNTLFVAGTFAGPTTFGSVTVTNVGARDLFVLRVGLPSPLLRIARTNQQVRLTWPFVLTNYVLQSSTNLPPSWTNFPAAILTTNSENSVLVSPSNSARYFRLNFVP